jgi:imidazolonepropionase-like amidohydrolase
VVSGQFITRTGGHAWYFGDEADGVDAIRRAVRKQAKHGVDLIKVMATGGIGTKGSDPVAPGFTREEMIAAIDEAHALGYKVSAHIHGGPVARWAIDAGLDTLEHGIFLNDDDLRAMVDHGTYLVVTYGLIDAALALPHVPDFFKVKAAAAQASYDRVIARAVELGVKIAVGGDTYHADMPDELRGLVKGGMTPLDAIAAATRNGADAAGILNETGTIEVGKFADLVALDGDPLQDVGVVGRVKGVMKAGDIVV